MKKSVVLLLLSIACFAFNKVGEKLFFVPKNFPKPVYDFTNNKLTKEKILLGKLLFNDPILSRNNSISCSSCHLSFTAFTHNDHALSHGIEDRIGTRNAPSLANLAWSKNFMWDGSIHHLDAQALAPISNHLEMDETIENVVSKLQNIKKYKALFFNAYKDSTITGDHTLKAISQFLVTLVSANSKYDKVMRNEKGIVFTDNENKGYNLFKKNCVSCHKEPLFTNNTFENNGLTVDTFFNDKGRMLVTQNPNDSLKFKVPSLRNCEVTYPYMHDGRFNNLQMVLFHYTHTIQQSKTLSQNLSTNLLLSEEDKRNIILFLKTLTDESFLRKEEL